MDMEDGRINKRQKFEVESDQWRDRTLPPPRPHQGPPQYAPQYQQPPRSLSSPHTYPEGVNGYDHNKPHHPPMQDTRQHPGPHMPPYSPGPPYRSNDIKPEPNHEPRYQRLSQPPIPSPRLSGSENGHYQSPPNHTPNPYEPPNGHAANPQQYHGRVATMPAPIQTITNRLSNVESHYGRSPDTATISNDGIYSPSHFPPPQPNNVGKKKAQRASQACDSCRQLKAKCDESKPCQSCKDKGIECTYRQPEPKAQDKIQSDMLQKIQTILENVHTMKDILQTVTLMSAKVDKLDRRLQIIEERVPASDHSDWKLDEKNGISSSPQSVKSHRSELTITPHAMQPEQAEQAESDYHASDEDLGPPINPRQPKFGIRHTTGAAELLKWPTVSELVSEEVKDHRIHQGKGSLTDRYLWKAEKRRGELRVYGYGEGSAPKYTKEYDSGGSEGQVSIIEASSPPVFSERPFGPIASDKQSKIVYTVGKKTKDELVGGLLLNETLDLRESTVTALVEKYMRNMNDLHPILTKAEVQRLVNEFLAEVKATPESRPTAPRQAPPFVGDSRKRKNTPDLVEHHSTSDPNPDFGLRLPQRSPANAVVLLMLAIGKICEARRIPEVTWGATHLSSSDFKKVKGSASPDHSSPSSPSSAQASPYQSNSRMPEDERNNITNKPRPLKNADVLHGMAYFRAATDIIGNELSGSTMRHIQANLLASLYLGQLVRPVQSYAHVHVASRAIQEKVRLKSYLSIQREKMPNCEPKDNPLVYAFWTCLQLECDIVAELACVHSGILGYEELMPYPNTEYSISHDEMSPKVAKSYHAQLWLRKHLNDLHANYQPSGNAGEGNFFYTKKRQPAQYPTIEAVEVERKLQFGFNEELNENLFPRQMLWPELTWNFDDPFPDLANNILDARTRAKFYGARVITYRPFVRAMLEFSWNENSRLTNGESPPMAHIDTSALGGLIDTKLGNPPRKWTGDPNTPLQKKAEHCYGNAHWKYLKLGIQALIHSTEAFHGLRSKRLIVTNMFGTAHAQWGNVLVLLACYSDTNMRPTLFEHITEEKFKALVKKTLDFLISVAPSNSGLQLDIKILKAAVLKSGILNEYELRTPESMSSLITTGSGYEMDISQ